MSPSKQPVVAIIGAGLTGLTTAFYLKKAGIRVHLFEKADRVGGVIKTHCENDFIFESGPNTGVLSHPEAVQLFEDLGNNCKQEIADQAAKSRWIWKSGRWEPLPSGLIGGITTPLFTFPDKIRLLGEPFRKRGVNPDETLKELVLRRMGKSFLDYAVDPFILGIYSGDPARLVTKYALPKLYRLEQEFGSFIGGSIKKSRIPKTDWEKKATREIFSVSGGLQNLIDALKQYIGSENISLNRTVIVHKEGDFNFLIENEYFSHVISTTGAYELIKLIPFLNSEKMKLINQLEYAKVVQVSLGFREWAGLKLNAFGGLVPSKENHNLLGILFLSSFLKNRAPENGALLSVFLGGVRNPEMVNLPDHRILAIVEKEFKEMMRLEKFIPDLVKIFRYQHAIPQYGIESKEKLAAISDLEKTHPGLFLAGNIRDGIGMADRIRQGRTLARQIANKP